MSKKEEDIERLRTSGFTRSRLGDFSLQAEGIMLWGSCCMRYAVEFRVGGLVALGFRVRGLGISGVRVEGLGLRVWGLGFGVQDLRFGVWSVGFGVWCLMFGV